MFQNASVNKQYKKTVRSVIFGIVLLTLAVLLLVVGMIRTGNARKNMLHLNDVILSEDRNKNDKFAYLDTTGFFSFASYGDDYGYYIAYDDDFFYLIGMSNKDFDYFAKEFEDKDYLTLYGYTAEIPSEAWSYAIESLNEEMGEEFVSYRNFNDVFGDTLLEVRRKNSVFGLGGFLKTAPLETALAGLCLLFGLILLLTGMGQRKSYETVTDDALRELNDPETKERPDMKLLFGDKHMYSYNGKLDVIDYDDIFWVYPTRHSTNGISDYNYLNICTKDGRRVNCANGSAFGKKKQSQTNESHQEIMDFLYEKNPEIRMGYLQENVQAYTELVKSLRKK